MRNELDKRLPIVMGSAMFGPKGRDNLRCGTGWTERRTLGLGWILYGFTRAVTPTTIVEVGTGGSSVCLLQAIEDNSKGHLYTVDSWPSAPPDTDHGVNHRFHPDGKPYAYQHSFFLDLLNKEKWNEICTLYYMDGPEFAIKWDKPIDILVVDGGHLKEETRLEWENLSKWIVPGGYAFFHDFIACINEIGLLFEDYISKHDDFSLIVEPDYLSMAILQKKYTVKSKEFWTCARLAQEDNPNRSDEDRHLTAARDSGIIGEWNGKSHFPPMDEFMAEHYRIIKEPLENV
ncbi:MAG: class I SAM-dependent methyltransferase [Novosphingobium sp.]|jgi:hypothetical protein|nr:class I SAM-dependent methyltransferase [Novosphingobium sp.]